MSRVVFVHGICQGRLTREELLAATRADLVRNDLIGDADSVAAPYYADCHRDPGAMGSVDDPFGVDVLDGIDQDDPVQVELLRLFEASIPSDGAMGLSRSFLDRYARSPNSSTLQQIIVSLIREVSRHLNKPAIRECAFRRVGAAITEETRLVVGHSLGSVVAYGALFRHTLENPPTLLTLGSPLGLAPVRASLQKRHAMSDGKLPAPPVEAWINISVADDWVPAVPKLGEFFDGVEDRALPGSGIFGPPSHVVHGRSSYLELDEVAEAVRGALAR